MEIPAGEKTEGRATEALERSGSESWERHEGMMSSGDTSPRHEDGDTHVQERLKQDLKDAKKQLEMTTTRIHTIEEELVRHMRPTREHWRRRIKRWRKRLKR